MNELSKSLMCIQLRSGVEIWVEQDRASKLQRILETMTGHKFVNFDDQSINTADVVGVFKASTMDEYTRRKNGQWKCDGGKWHDRGEKCVCLSANEQAYAAMREAIVKNCGKCQNGYVLSNKNARLCECVQQLTQKENED